MSREPLAVTLNTIHNVTYYQRLMSDIRDAIAADTFAAYAQRAPWAATNEDEEAACLM
jgi:tRNA-guanine family transglycosylase